METPSTASYFEQVTMAGYASSTVQLLPVAQTRTSQMGSVTHVGGTPGSPRFTETLAQDDPCGQGSDAPHGEPSLEDTRRLHFGSSSVHGLGRHMRHHVQARLSKRWHTGPLPAKPHMHTASSHAGSGGHSDSPRHSETKSASFGETRQLLPRLSETRLRVSEKLAYSSRVSPERASRSRTRQRRVGS